MNAVQAGRLYDSLPSGQSLGRQEFVKQAVALTDPDAYHRDVQTLLTMRGNAQAERTKIERAMRHE